MCLLLFSNMKGISPVITTVLLLLLALAAVGSSWVFIQNMQTSATAGSQSQVDEYQSQASIIVSLESITATDNSPTVNDTLTIKLANPSLKIAKITRVLAENSTGSSFSTTNTVNMAANDFTDFIIVVPNTTDVKNFCPQTKFIKISVYSDAYKVINDYPMECDY